MKLRAALVSAAIALSPALWLGGATATPSVWQQAAEPQRHREAEVVEAVSHLLSEHLYLRRQPTSFRRTQLLQQALSLLDEIGAAGSSDPSLRYQLGQVLEMLYQVEATRTHLEHAVTHFEAVATSQAPTTTRARALRLLALCQARLGNHREEVEAYDRSLQLEPDPEVRAVVLANQAEGRMALGQILEAVRGYRAALSILPAVLMLDSGVTTLWGQAVALDRSGDLGGALDSIRRARSYDPIDRQIHGEDWFYVPDYDVHWYDALGHWQRARAAEGEAAMDAYADSIASWRAYLDRAAPDDPWVPIASRRLSQCERERHQADERRHRR